MCDIMSLTLVGGWRGQQRDCEESARFLLLPNLKIWRIIWKYEMPDLQIWKTSNLEIWNAWPAIMENNLEIWNMKWRDTRYRIKKYRTKSVDFDHILWLIWPSVGWWRLSDGSGPFVKLSKILVINWRKYSWWNTTNRFGGSMIKSEKSIELQLTEWEYSWLSRSPSRIWIPDVFHCCVCIARNGPKLIIWSYDNDDVDYQEDNDHRYICLARNCPELIIIIVIIIIIVKMMMITAVSAEQEIVPNWSSECGVNVATLVTKLPSGCQSWWWWWLLSWWSWWSWWWLLSWWSSYDYHDHGDQIECRHAGHQVVLRVPVLKIVIMIMMLMTIIMMIMMMIIIFMMMKLNVSTLLTRLPSEWQSLRLWLWSSC